MADRSLAFAIPGDIERPTGGYGYDRRLIAELRATGWTVTHVPLPDRFPEPTAQDRAASLAALGQRPKGEPLLIDALAFAVMEVEAPILARERPLVALVHHPLALERGLSPARAEAFRRSERAALAHAHAVVVTSPATATTLIAEFAVPECLITVAVPGTDPVAQATGSTGPTVRLVTVGSLVPRKGHLDLIAALSTLRHLDWRLELIGDPTLDPGHATAVAEAIAGAGLSERIELVGALARDQLETRYRAADIFALASHYEGYGMAYAEAIAHGLPVVGTTGGAIADTLGDAAELVTPGDVDALATTLARLIGDRTHRTDRSVIARTAAHRLPNWRATADAVAGAVIGAAERRI
ncbi:glycosyltransferase family 4 protein [Ancylobacter terrae]|uniref:glycosyltransferase family 4 protein n=1 Tax=Ancylobacter sp. sgz301288 TaxID=3342077 RepID=UPI00385EE396